MKKIVCILLLVFLLPGCSRIVILRKNKNLVAPFNEKSLPKGSYEVALYKVNYPTKLKEKQLFLNEFNILLKKYYLGNKKINILIDKNFYNDLKSLESTALLEEEKIFDKAASLLSEEEIQILLKNSNKRIEKFKGSTQEYLNFQVEYLLKFLGREITYDENKIYSEREKSSLIDEIREVRKENVNLLKELTLGFVLELDNPYENGDQVVYWDNREILLKNSSSFSKEVNTYDIPIYIKNIKDSDVMALIKEEYKINNKIIILDNSIYDGYKNLGESYLFLVGGEKPIKSYENYNFKIKLVEVELKEMVNLKNSITLTEILGGNK